MYDAIAKASFEKSGAGAHAFAKTTEVILETALFLRPLDRLPLQQVAGTKFASFRSRSPNVPAPNARAKDRSPTP